ncbi:MAG: trypsin-like serine protease [Paracoccaceae bacterium]
MFRAFTLFALLVVAAPLAAQTPLRSLNSADAARDWQAVGRLSINNGHALCSATLITNRLVLTAAHCLFGANNTAYPPESIEFQPGWRNGGAAAYRRAKRYAIHPEFQFSGQDWAYRLARDIAIIELDLPVHTSGIAPLNISGHAPESLAVSVISYAVDRANAPSIEEDCAIVARESGAMLLSCSAGPGASGAPILANVNGELQMVGLISAIAQWGGEQVSAGVEIGPAMAVLLPLLREAPGGITFRPAQASSLAEQLGRTNP